MNAKRKYIQSDMFIIVVRNEYIENVFCLYVNMMKQKEKNNLTNIYIYFVLIN